MELARAFESRIQRRASLTLLRRFTAAIRGNDEIDGVRVGQHGIRVLFVGHIAQPERPQLVPVVHDEQERRHGRQPQPDHGAAAGLEGERRRGDEQDEQRVAHAVARDARARARRDPQRQHDQRGHAAGRRERRHQHLAQAFAVLRRLRALARPHPERCGVARVSTVSVCR